MAWACLSSCCSTIYSTVSYVFCCRSCRTSSQVVEIRSERNYRVASPSDSNAPSSRDLGVIADAFCRYVPQNADAQTSAVFDNAVQYLKRMEQSEVGEIAIVVDGAKGRVIGHNNRLNAVLGFQENVLLGRPVMDIMPVEQVRTHGDWDTVTRTYFEVLSARRRFPSHPALIPHASKRSFMPFLVLVEHLDIKQARDDRKERKCEFKGDRKGTDASEPVATMVSSSVAIAATSPRSRRATPVPPLSSGETRKLEIAVSSAAKVDDVVKKAPYFLVILSPQSTEIYGRSTPQDISALQRLMTTAVSSTPSHGLSPFTDLAAIVPPTLTLDEPPKSPKRERPELSQRRRALTATLSPVTPRLCLPGSLAIGVSGIPPVSLPLSLSATNVASSGLVLAATSSGLISARSLPLATATSGESSTAVADSHDSSTRGPTATVMKVTVSSA